MPLTRDQEKKKLNNI